MTPARSISPEIARAGHFEAAQVLSVVPFFGQRLYCTRACPMTRMPSVPPSLAALTADFLSRTEDAETLIAAADALGDVLPHEVSVGYRAEPRLAWQESLEVLSVFGQKPSPISAP